MKTQRMHAQKLREDRFWAGCPTTPRGSVAPHRGLKTKRDPRAGLSSARKHTETVRKSVFLWLFVKKALAFFCFQPVPTKMNMNSSGIKPPQMGLGDREK